MVSRLYLPGRRTKGLDEMTELRPASSPSSVFRGRRRRPAGGSLPGLREGGGAARAVSSLLKRPSPLPSSSSSSRSRRRSWQGEC